MRDLFAATCRWQHGPHCSAVLATALANSAANVAASIAAMASAAEPHSYLPTGQHFGRFTSLECGATVSLLTLVSNDAVFPSETMPIVVAPTGGEASALHRALSRCLRDVTELPLLAHVPRSYRGISRTGVTLEIISASTHRAADDPIRLVVVARQRVELIRSGLRSGTLFEWRVLPFDTTPPLRTCRGGALLHGGALLRGGAPVQRMLDVEHHCTALFAQAAALGMFAASEPPPTSWQAVAPTATAFSFAVASRLPNLNGIGITFLDEDSTLTRLVLLRWHLNYVTHASLCCRKCNRRLAKFSEILAAAGAGLPSLYVNPSGAVFRIGITQRANVRVASRPTTQDTWFAGFGWSIGLCPTCHQHVGWRYDWMPPHRVDESRVVFNSGSRRMEVATSSFHAEQMRSVLHRLPPAGRYTPLRRVAGRAPPPYPFNTFFGLRHDACAFFYPRALSNDVFFDRASELYLFEGDILEAERNYLRVHLDHDDSNDDDDDVGGGHGGS